MQRQPHTTKTGPGRRHKDGTPRGGKRGRVGGVGSYGRGLTNATTRKQLDAIEAKHRQSEAA